MKHKDHGVCSVVFLSKENHSLHEWFNEAYGDE